MADENTPAQDTEGEWVVLYDPAWHGESQDEKPPVEAMVGGWYVEADGTRGPFEPNPEYEPFSAESPTDPVDAVLRFVATGEADGTALLESLRDAPLGIAIGEDGAAIVAPAPDDVPSVLVVTAPFHSRRLNVPNFRDVSAREIAEALPEEGVDVVLNPGGPHSMRLVASAFRDAVAGPGQDRVD